MNPDDKIQIYCGENFENYHKALEEKFSHAALQAVSKSDLANIKLDDPATKEKISRLFSTKFEKEWPKDKDSNPTKDPRKILKYVLDRTFFMQCIRLDCK